MSISAGDTQACSRFQSGLLAWLRAKAPQDHASGLREMIAVTRTLAEADRDTGSDGLLWRSASSFLQALLDGSLSADDESRSLCRRLERQLAARAAEAPGSFASFDSARARADALAGAIFDFVSNRQAGGNSEFAAAPLAASEDDIATVSEEKATDAADSADSTIASTPTRALDPSVSALLGAAFSATADVLPLLGNATPQRFSDAQQARWQTAVGALRRDWDAVQTGDATDCRAAAIGLLQVALELADPPSLRLAEAFAEASAATEDRAVLALPAFRAAFAAALEVAAHPDGPEQKGFADNAGALAKRLGQSARPPRPGAGLVCPSAPWFSEDARETLIELAAALDAVPPDRAGLLAGFHWFVQHESGKVMAIRGLATTAHKVIGQIRADDLDEVAAHATLQRVIAAMRQAVSELAEGIPPLPDEEVFAQLRALDARVFAQRQAAIAAARQAETARPPADGAPPLQ